MSNKYEAGSLSDSLVRFVMYYIQESYNGNVTVLQIGANDGVRGDPVNRFIKRFGWQAVLCEPVPSYFERLKEEYSTCLGVQVLNVAVSNKRSNMQIYYIPFDLVPPDRPWEQGLASLNRQHLIDNGVLDKSIRNINVPVESFNELVKDNRLNKVHLLVIDVEGHEQEIFSSIDFESFQAEIIIWESKHNQQNVETIKKRLKSHGYNNYELTNDTVSIYKPKNSLHSILSDAERLCRSLLAATND